MGARKYGKLYTSIHRNVDWRTLGVDAQWLYKVLLSQPNVDTCGVLPLQIAKWASCSVEMTPERVQAALNVLTEKWYVHVDYTTQEVLIRTYLQYDVLAAGTSKMLIGALRSMLQVQSDELRTVLASEAAINGVKVSVVDEVQRLLSILFDSLPEGYRKAIESHPKGYREAFESLREGLFVFVSKFASGGTDQKDQTWLPRSGRSPEDEPPPEDDEWIPPSDDHAYDLATSERGSELGRPAPATVAKLIGDIVPPRRAVGPERSRLIMMAADVERVYGIETVGKALRKWVETNKGAQILMSVAADVNAEGFHSEYSKPKERPLATGDRNFIALQAMKDPNTRVSPQELFGGNVRELRRGSQ